MKMYHSIPDVRNQNGTFRNSITHVFILFSIQVR